MAPYGHDIPAPAELAALYVGAGDRVRPLPDWAIWFVWLGQWMRTQVPLVGRRVAVVRTPTRRTAAAFATLGALFESSRMHDDSLDWDALKSLAPGTHVFWREPSGSRSRPRSGEVVGTRFVDDQEFLVVTILGGKKDQPVTCSFTRRTTLGYGITLGTVSAKGDERLAGSQRFMKAVVGGASPGWIRSPIPDCVVLSERTSFFNDLAGTWLSSGSGVSEPILDILAISTPGGLTHGKTKLLPARQHGVLDAVGQLTILDGAQATLRITDTVAGSVLAILDPSEYDEEIEHVLMGLLGAADDAFVHVPPTGLSAPPQGLEVAVFGLPPSHQSTT